MATIKHHIMRDGKAICGARKATLAAIPSTKLGEVCGRCVSIAGPKTPSMVREHYATVLEDAALSLPREILSAGLLAIDAALFKPGASEVERCREAQSALMQIVAEQEG